MNSLSKHLVRAMRHCIIAGGIFCVASANAAVTSATGKITRIATGWNGEGIYISLSVPVSSPCPSNAQLVMPPTATQYKEAVAIALAARAQDKVVTVFYENATCPGGYSPTFVAISDSTW